MKIIPDYTLENAPSPQVVDQRFRASATALCLPNMYLRMPRMGAPAQTDVIRSAFCAMFLKIGAFL